MSDRYINELLLEYEKLRTNAEQQAKTRQIEVYKKIPRIKDIDASLRKIGLEIAKAVIKGNDDMKNLIEREKKVCTDLRVEKAELLTKHNFPADYIEPKYRCPDCQDTGYIGTEKCHCNPYPGSRGI